jgi:hypothetical protein
MANWVAILTPEVLQEYKATYEEWKNRNPPSPAKNNESICKLKTSVAKDYVDFWNCVDHVRDLFDELPGKLFSKLPPCIAIDHFWHYLVSECDAATVKDTIDIKGQTCAIRELFSDYAKWIVHDQYFTEQLPVQLNKLHALLNPG